MTDSASPTRATASRTFTWTVSAAGSCPSPGQKLGNPGFENGSGPWTATFSKLNHASGYKQRSFNLSAFAGQTVTLKFTGAEDSSLQTSFVVGDTAVNVS